MPDKQMGARGFRMSGYPGFFVYRKELSKKRNRGKESLIAWNAQTKSGLIHRT